MKKYLTWIALPVFMIFIMLSMSSCYVGRFFYWNFADINDYKKFQSLPVAKNTETFKFKRISREIVPGLSESFASETKTNNFDSFLEDHKTVAFLIIRNDSILYEKYFKGFSDSSIIPSFSLSKSFVSALVGIAIGEGYIKSTKQPVTDFIPELKQNDPRFEKITLEDLLNMRSGIRFNEGYGSPFADMAKYYYGLNLNKYISKLKIESPSGEKYNYISVNTELLGISVERATGKKLSEYLEEKIWRPLEMEYNASWSIDSKKDEQIKAFCCINARARDFAKFGRLYLNGGKYNGKQIIPGDWVKRSMSVINDSRDSQNYPYTYQWRVKEDGAIFAKGVLGQYIYIFPAKNVIIVRLGKKTAGINWAGFMEKLCEEL
jgi:CubicO group peptidase (beta-lactamase class C family)